MSGDSKIGPVGGIARTTPLRSVASESAAAARAAAPPAVGDNLPAARLIRLAGGLANQTPPVDVARVASLRSAIASGNYGVHPAIIASAMIDFHTGGGE
ncbi:flagellar biosynthesis anti-sigma factor FlgM [Sphingopyxis sp.]|jgi:negative regulator of flagellin synthesis FlgM|uniref:flagellar biosynthesis anti-sigma factor FlgM n=1 Tax=Sphingopyxis sp. TaxID=1908224 RepID=UPI003F6F1517